MSNLMQVGATFLAGKLKSFASESVTFTRKGQAAVSFYATPQMQEYELADQEGMLTRVVSRDYIYTAADLSVTPRPGDRVRETIAGVVCEFEVMTIGDRPAFEFSDTSNIMALMHTRKVT